jgi:hypothetical protein
MHFAITLPTSDDNDKETGDAVWLREITLRDVWVADAPATCTRDIYVAWRDFDFLPGNEAISPLGSARVAVAHNVNVAAAAPVASLSDADFRERLLARIPLEKRNSTEARRLVDSLVLRRKVFGPINPEECTEVVDFELISNEPDTVSFRYTASCKVQKAGNAAFAPLHSWIDQQVAHRVPWDTPAYGFTFIVPKPNGKFRRHDQPRRRQQGDEARRPQGRLHTR